MTMTHQKLFRAVSKATHEIGRAELLHGTDSKAHREAVEERRRLIEEWRKLRRAA